VEERSNEHSHDSRAVSVGSWLMSKLDDLEEALDEALGRIEHLEESRQNLVDTMTKHWKEISNLKIVHVGHVKEPCAHDAAIIGRKNQ